MYNDQGQLTPDLATDLPAISNDGKAYTVSLKPGLTWHDGAPVTSNDVVFTIAKIQDPTIRSPLRGLWLSTTVQAIDDYTVVFITKEESGPFVHNLTIGLLPEHIWHGVAPENFASTGLNIKPLGNGPYAIRLIENTPSKKVTKMLLDSFANFTRPPFLDTITITFFENQDEMNRAFSGQEINALGIGLADPPPDAPRNLFKATSVSIPQYQALFLNTKSNTLTNVQVREALLLAISPVNITQTAWPNRAESIEGIPLGNKNTNKIEPLQPDPVKAETLLAAAGWKKTISGVRAKGRTELTINLATLDTPAFRTAAELIQVAWANIGVRTNITSVATTQLISEYVRPRNFDALLFSEKSNADPDPFAFWHSSQAKDPGLNVSGLAVPQIDKLITDARTNTDQTTRRALYEQLSTLLKAQHVVMYVNQSLYTYLSNPGLQGIQVTRIPDPSWMLALSTSWYTKQTRTWK
jgi:peptide/nickel transport system substrate-binding protein